MGSAQTASSSPATTKVRAGSSEAPSLEPPKPSPPTTAPSTRVSMVVGGLSDWSYEGLGATFVAGLVLLGLVLNPLGLRPGVGGAAAPRGARSARPVSTWNHKASRSRCACGRRICENFGWRGLCCRCYSDRKWGCRISGGPIAFLEMVVYRFERRRRRRIVRRMGRALWRVVRKVQTGAKKPKAKQPIQEQEQEQEQAVPAPVPTTAGPAASPAPEVRILPAAFVAPPESQYAGFVGASEGHLAIRPTHKQLGRSVRKRVHAVWQQEPGEWWVASSARRGVSELARELPLKILPEARVLVGLTPGEPVLEPRLVPRTAWCSNVRNHIPTEIWQDLSRYLSARAGYRCEYCGRKGPAWPTECNELWEYDDAAGVQ